jgi:Fe-S cluster biogenesis protein NfuA
VKLSDVIKRQSELKDDKTKKPSPPPLAGGKTFRPKANAEKKSIVKVLRTRETPNMHALQFVLNAFVLENGNKNYLSKEDCQGDRLGEELLDLDPVKGVFVMDNFVTVTKEDGVEWDFIKDHVWQTVDRFAHYYETTEKEKPDSSLFTKDFTTLSEEDKLKTIEAVLDRSIRANLARDGGGVELKGIEENVILIHYQGACSSCSTSASGTLQFIEKQVKQQLDRSLTVKSV